MSNDFTSTRTQRFSHERLAGLVAVELGIMRNEVFVESSLVDDLGLDRFDIFELVEHLEAVYRTKLEDADVEGLKSLSDLARALESASP